ncbi:response regulator [Methyloferula stellata]|uniref:response regulator n=1 Tax=Methyloferula stellata TaxID=876270 RepID=UPI00037E028A|nr:response regulator [Methyloferula stellata]
MESFQHCRTLIVDENILACALLEETLKLLGFRVIHTASRLDTAHHLIREAQYDLVLLDWPSNRDLLKALRGEQNRQSPAIVATGFDKDPRSRLAIIQDGADAYINAPFSKVQVLITMEYVLKDFLSPPWHLRLYSPATAALGPSSPIVSRS